jgi:hypothetical protein
VPVVFVFRIITDQPQRIHEGSGMASIDTDTTVSPQPVSRRRRWAWITVATVGLVSASAFLAVPAIADSGGSPSDTTSTDKVVVCESSVDTQGDVQMSAATATRVADGDTTPVPEGCREG